VTSPSLGRRTHRWLTALTAAALIAGTGAAAAAKNPTDPSKPTPVSRVSKDDHINYVVGISVDGLNPDAIRKLGPGRVRYLSKMINSGATTLNARTAVESTSTLPNHTSMLTSRKIAVRDHGHGVLFNDDNAGKRTVHSAARSYVHSVFDVVHDNGRATSLYTSKGKFEVFNRSWDSKRGAADRTGANNGRDKISTFVYRESENTLVSLVRNDLRRSPDAFTFVHFSQTDKIGHKYGYMSNTYLNAVRQVDARIGVIMNTISTDARLRNNAAIVLTSDHGGYGKSHSTITSRVNYTVPFMVWGKGISKVDLYALNRSYRSPGTARPGYSGAQPIRNGALGNLSLDLLDLPAIPRSQINAGHNLNALR
jgi:hypothetical protein